MEIMELGEAKLDCGTLLLALYWPKKNKVTGKNWANAGVACWANGGHLFGKKVHGH